MPQPAGVCLTRVGSTAVALFAVLIAAGAAQAAGPVDLLSNGGFEWGDWEWQSVWGHQGHEVATGEAHSGRAGMYFSSAGAIRTQRYAYHGGPVRISGWYKLRQVKQGEKPWYKFWVTLEAYDSEGKGLRHADCLLRHGTCDWALLECVVPALGEEVRSIALSVSLHNTTGEVWVDDLQISADARLDRPAWKLAEQPYYTGKILPRPKTCAYGGEIPIWDADRASATVKVDLGNRPGRIAAFGQRQIRYRLTSCGRAMRFGVEPAGGGERVLLHLGRFGDEHIRRVARRMRYVLPDLGAQGHVVRMVKRGRRWDVLAAGTDDLGVAYAAASIVQMIGVTDRGMVLRRFDLQDEPTYPLRAGSDYGAINDAMMARLAMCKVPVYAVQHRKWWRLTSPEGPSPGKGRPYSETLAQMCEWTEQTRALELMFLIHIYTPSGRPLDETGPVFDIAAEKDISDLTERLKWLYDLGFHIQMVCVDDYVDAPGREYLCKTQAEEAKFGTIGRAHGYLMRRLWEELDEQCPELKLSLVTGPYSTSHLGGQVTVQAGRRYLRHMCEQMPRQVAVVWTGPRITSPTITREDWRHYQSLVPGCPLYVWDNNQGRLPIPMFDVDFYPGMEKDSAWGLMYLNAHFVGWPHTLPAHLAANDYLSNPTGYDALATHEEAVRKAYGGVDYADVRAINEGYGAARSMVRSGDFDRGKLLATVEAIYGAVERLEAIGAPMSVPRRQMSAAGVVPTIANRLDNLEQATVPRVPQAPEIDGELDDPAWENAPRLGPFEHYMNSETNTFEGTLHEASCRLVYDDEALYIACKCEHGQIELRQHGHIGKRDAPVYFESDAIEMFLMPRPAAGKYAHLVVDHTGTVFDEMPVGTSSWNGDWQWAVGKGEGVWRLEVRVPFEALGTSTPEAGEKWRANFCRAFAQADNQFSVWARTYGSFHNWPFYGWLVFE